MASKWDAVSSPVSENPWDAVSSPVNSKDALQNAFAAKKGNDAGRIAATVGGFNSVTPFGRKITSALGAGIADLAGAGDFKDLYNQAEEDSQATADAHPGYNIAGAGLGLGNSLLLASAKPLFGTAVATTGVRGAVNAIPSALGAGAEWVAKPVFNAGTVLAKAGNFGVEAAKSALLGIPGGAIYGASEAKTGDELQGAEKGAVLGAGFGSAVPAISSTLNKAVGKVQSVLTQREAKNALQQYITASNGGSLSNLTDKSVLKVVTRLRADFPDDASFMEALDHVANGKTIAEAGGDRTTNLAKGAAQYPSGEAITKDFIGNQIDAAPSRIKSSIAKNISDNPDFYQSLQDNVKQGQAAAAPKYKEAFNGPAMTSEKFLKVIDRNPDIRAALSAGLKTQQIEHDAAFLRGDVDDVFDPKQYGITGFNEAGDPIIEGVPNIRLLDAGKRGLDGMIANEKNQVTGRLTDRGLALNQLRKSYLSEIDNINPAYKEARSISGDYLSNESAAKEGLKFMSTDDQLIGKAYSSFNDAEKKSYKSGVVKSIYDRLDSASDNRNLYNEVFGSATKRDRIMRILSPTEFKNISGDLAGEKKLYQLRDQVLGGSPTQSKNIAAQEFQDHMGDLAQDVIKKGTFKTVVDKSTSFILKKFDGLSDNTAGQVAQALYETDPQKKIAILNKIRLLSPNEAKPAFNAFFNLRGAVSRSSIPVVEVNARSRSK